jgi:hypothetical protein
MAALASALSLLSFGCGGTNHLQSITLTSSGTTLTGIGGTVQLTAKGISSNGSTSDISGKVKYTVTPTGTDFQNNPLPAPPLTVNFNATGQITAVSPADCTFKYVAGTTPPVYFLSGSYQVVATMDGVTSLPLFIAVASSSGGGPNQACNT